MKKKKKIDGQYNVKIPVKGKPLEENDIKLVVFFFVQVLMCDVTSV